MNLFIDCEFNEHQGDLISMALVAENGSIFYEVIPCHNPKAWVREHVMPVLNKTAIELDDMRQKIQQWLSQFDHVHLIADWPTDIELFCKTLVLDGGYRLDTPPLTMEILRDIDTTASAIRHNALSDARALKISYEGKEHAYIRSRMS